MHILWKLPLCLKAIINRRWLKETAWTIKRELGEPRGRGKWLTAGFFSFETTQRAICQIVGQWILFRRNSQCCQPSHKIRNPLSILQEWQNAVSWNELVKISSKLAKFVKRLMLSFAICCQGIRTRLSRFSSGEKIQRKFCGEIRQQSVYQSLRFSFFLAPQVL